MGRAVQDINVSSAVFKLEPPQGAHMQNRYICPDCHKPLFEDHVHRCTPSAKQLAYDDHNLSVSASLWAQRFATDASLASTITRTKGSVPLGRMSTRPVLPNSASTSSCTDLS